MTLNIEQRTQAATATMEGAAKAVDEIANTDKDVSTPVGSRKSFPKISREWDEKATELKTTWENDSATLRQDWQNERNELSTKALGVKPWESGVSETNINQQRRWDDGHTYLPKTVPAVMDAGGPNDEWIPYTADKSDTLNDVFGRKPVDLVSGISLYPDENQNYQKLFAFGKTWELDNSDRPLSVLDFSETQNGYLSITLADSSVVVAHKLDGASRVFVKQKVHSSRNESVGLDVYPDDPSESAKIDDELSKNFALKIDSSIFLIKPTPESFPKKIKSIDKTAWTILFYDDVEEYGLFKQERFNVSEYVLDYEKDGDLSTEWNKAAKYGLRSVVLSYDGVATQSLLWPDFFEVKSKGGAIVRVTKQFNGDLVPDFGKSAGFSGIEFWGNADNGFTGQGFLLNGTNGRQWASRPFSIRGFKEPCLAIAKDAGSQMAFEGGIISRLDGGTEGNCSVVISSEQNLLAKTRKFDNIECEGTLFIDFGGSNNTYASNCFCGGYVYTDESRAAQVNGGRITGLIPLGINGHQNTIIGTDISPEVELMPGTDDNVIMANQYNNGIIDNSGNSRNVVTIRNQKYDVQWRASTVNPVLNDGHLRAEYARNGTVISVSIDLRIGVGTTLGEGWWSFTLPQKSFVKEGMVQSGTATALINGAYQTLIYRIIRNTDEIEIFIPGGIDKISADKPELWTAESRLYLNFNYLV